MKVRTRSMAVAAIFVSVGVMSFGGCSGQNDGEMTESVQPGPAGMGSQAAPCGTACGQPDNTVASNGVTGGTGAGTGSVGQTTGGGGAAVPSASGGTGGTGGDVTEGSGPSGDGRGLPCAVEEVVQARCVSCHSDPPVGTFMPLLTHDHFHEASTSDPSRTYWELAAERIVDEANPMPPVQAEPLTADEQATLDEWFAQGAPMSAEECGEVPSTGGGSEPTNNPQDIDTTGLTCHQFLAHAPGDKSTKFDLGVAVDAYFNMTFDSPWQGTTYGLVVKPVIDNAPVLHHWLLYYEPGGGGDGDVLPSSGQHTGGELIHGWAPGGIALDFREYGDVGFELQAGTYLLELHYNSNDASAQDASGVEVCYQDEQPEHIAGLSWLGLDWGPESYLTGAILGTASSGACLEPRDEWVGTCVPLSQEPIHIMFVVPHMHEAGRHMSGVINGPNGSRVLHDEPFDFSSQIGYDVNEILMPGETITTTCQFSEPKCSGQATGAEMCYLYTYAYPKGALVDGMPWGALAHGEGTCLGQ